ncbi:LLM class flavin-dependent oxidoreductase [Longivirga aurantiaca]|uniref:LLM class flavin-dependent oxidoreductase n=1 Tax=Longivirga aurantiaca TaxID=1837743 RepID=A0ABW1SV98_9ACTN
MRFSVFLTWHELDPASNGETNYADHLAQAKLADSLGYDGISMPEHPLVHIVKSPNALINAVGIGQHVRCDVAVHVLVLPLHHPLQLAGDVAAADHALDGRLVLGVGRGAYRYEFDRFGVDFNSSRGRFLESLNILEKIWEHPDGAVSYDGEFWSFDDTYVWPRPISEPRPPIWIAGQTAATIEWAVDNGYNVLNALMRRQDAIAEDVAGTFHNRREMNGLSRDEVQLGISRPTFITKDPDRIRRRIEEAGTLHQIHTHMHNFTENADPRSYVAPKPVPDMPTAEDIRTGMLLGSGEQILERIERYHELGIDEIHLGMGFGAPQAEILDSIQEFAEDVMAPYRRNHGIPGPAPLSAVARESGRAMSTALAREIISLRAAERGTEAVATVREPEASFVTSKAWFKLRLHSRGSGPALMIVPDTGQQARDVEELASLLAQDHRVYVLERRGRGDSEDEATTYGLTREAETDLVQTLNALTEPVTVIGLGYGGALALRASTLTQTPMKGLILWDGGFELDSEAKARVVAGTERVEAAVATGDTRLAYEGYVIHRSPTALSMGSPDARTSRTIGRELRELALYSPLDTQVARLRMPIVSIERDASLADEHRRVLPDARFEVMTSDHADLTACISELAHVVKAPDLVGGNR